jgi:hypothetical protein
VAAKKEAAHLSSARLPYIVDSLMKISTCSGLP